MRWTLSKASALFGVALLIAGCATNKQNLLPANATMLDIWNRETGGPSGANRQLLDARAALRRPLSPTANERGLREQSTYTRTAQTEIDSQFHRLPNPDLAMYVFAHLAGTDPVPIPGYTTVFPLYQRVQYALPGERTEDY